MAGSNGAEPAVVQRLIAEGLVSVGQVARKLPPGRGERRHPNTVTRWVVRGKRGVRLEGFFGPDGTWWTSWQALARFFAALQPGGGDAPEARPDHARADAAAMRLRAMRSRRG